MTVRLVRPRILIAPSGRSRLRSDAVARSAKGECGCFGRKRPVKERVPNTATVGRIDWGNVFITSDRATTFTHLARMLSTVSR